MAERPHFGIRLLAIVAAAGVIGSTLAVLIPPFTIGRLLVVLSIVAFAAVGAIGVIRGEPVVGALASLGLLFAAEGVLEIAGALFLGSVTLVAAALLAAAEQFMRRRRED